MVNKVKSIDSKNAQIIIIFNRPRRPNDNAREHPSYELIKKPPNRFNYNLVLLDHLGL